MDVSHGLLRRTTSACSLGVSYGITSTLTKVSAGRCASRTTSRRLVARRAQIFASGSTATRPSLSSPCRGRTRSPPWRTAVFPAPEQPLPPPPRVLRLPFSRAKRASPRGGARSTGGGARPSPPPTPPTPPRARASALFRESTSGWRASRAWCGEARGGRAGEAACSRGRVC
jgi:hypothetical protein